LLGLAFQYEEAHRHHQEDNGQEDQEMIKRLGDDLRSGRAEASLERLARQKEIEAHRHEKKKR
jgi:hypothetical protein